MSQQGGTSPGDELLWHQLPRLNRPIIVAAFEGWNDAGDASSSAVQHLIDQWGAEPFASIDPEGFYDFTATRPHVALSEGGERRLIWPSNEFYGAQLKDRARDAILIRGIEPQLRWRTFCDLIMEVANRYHASLVVTIGALLADVPHTRPTVVYGSADNEAAAERLGLKASTYEGPTGIVGVLHSACRVSGIESASLWAAVPTYVPHAQSPKATLALLERLGKLIEVDIERTALEIESADYERQVTAFVSQDDDAAVYVGELEGQYDAGIDGDDETSPEAFVEQVERFLREQPD